MKIRADQISGAAPLDTLLAGYARGVLNAPLHVLVESHLALKPDSRRFVRALENIAASEILQQEAAPIDDRDARLASIFGGNDLGVDRINAPLITDRKPAPTDAGAIPHALARYLGCDLGDVAWRMLLPGVKEFRIEDNDDGEATLYWIRGGRKIPAHTHEGSEYTLVLRGAFSDVNGRYARGDIAVADMDVDHCPVADPDEDCFCFAVTDAPLRLTGPIGRIIQRFIKH
ncbi:MAG: transcriptional regulator [Salinarimonadaceae bacterium]|nr:MAG: transcriptional regulator [Salinarimonadaceae bacterium]